MFSSEVKILELIGSANLQDLRCKIVFADRRTTLGTYSVCELKMDFTPRISFKMK